LYVAPVAFEHLTGPTDPRVSEYRDIAEPELVRSRGLFVAEGRLVVRRLLEERRYAVRSMLVSEAARRGLDAVLSSVSDQIPVYICEAADFLGITGHNSHRGCLALVERPPSMAVSQLLSAKVLVVLEGVTDADNVGGVFRNAAAFGADAVLLSPTCCDPLYRKAIRTSMAATLRLPFARVEEWPEGLEQLRASAFTIVGLTPREPAMALDAFVCGPRTPRIALLVGTEGGGLTRAVEEKADYRIRIPIEPRIDSLNLAVAVGIALYRLRG
jgi:tRNA G18 (ribose-2'-O)-methylase SpoU